MKTNIIKWNELVFLEHVPHLDLHGYDRETARVAIQDFIMEKKKLKQPIFVIVHGIGTGVLRSTTQTVLFRHKMVQDYQIHPVNSGCTVVKIFIDKG